MKPELVVEVDITCVAVVKDLNEVSDPLASDEAHFKKELNDPVSW
jgi:hypothetical protein